MKSVKSKRGEDSNLDNLFCEGDYFHDDQKIVIEFKPEGFNNTNYVNTAKVLILKSRLSMRLSNIIAWVHKTAKIPQKESLVFYVNNRYIPSPNDFLQDIYDHHGSNEKLVLTYSPKEIWG